MYKNERNNHIQKLSTLINTSGLGIFLVVGLNGCDGVSDDCKNLNNLPQYKVDECKKHRNSTVTSTGSGTSSMYTGFFGAGTSADSSSGG